MSDNQQAAREWLPIVGWEGVYDVSSCGAVRKAAGAVIGHWINCHGYKMVRLSHRSTGRRVIARVHRLVAEAFIPNPDGLPFVGHIDHSRDNNDMRNLEWCTQAQNLAHMTRHGRRNNGQKGRRSPQAKLSDAQAEVIRNEYAAGGISHAALAVKHGASKRTVGRIIQGKTYV